MAITPAFPISRRRAVALVGGAALGLAAGPARSASIVRERRTALARGFNLPSWVDSDEGVAPSDPVLEALHDLGFGAIRLPVAGEQFIDADAETRRRASQRLVQALDQLTARGFAVIVELHPQGKLGALFDNAPEHAAAAVAGIWAALSRIVAGYSPDLVFPELLNEPPMDQDRWLKLRDRLATRIRKTCPDHTLIWGAARYQGIWETIDAPPLGDANAIVAVHYYTPMGFTHQCESWNGSPLARIGNLPFPASTSSPQVVALRARLAEAGDDEALEALSQEFERPWSEAGIAEDFETLAQWSKANDCHAIVNEFGVLNFCVDTKSRATWMRAVRRAAESNDIGWCCWELDQGFGIIKDRQSTEGFDHQLISALMDR